jgi:hypothetical protein
VIRAIRVPFQNVLCRPLLFWAKRLQAEASAVEQRREKFGRPGRTSEVERHRASGRFDDDLKSEEAAAMPLCGNRIGNPRQGFIAGGDDRRMPSPSAWRDSASRIRSAKSRARRAANASGLNVHATGKFMGHLAV